VSHNQAKLNYLGLFQAMIFKKNTFQMKQLKWLSKSLAQWNQSTQILHLLVFTCVAHQAQYSETTELKVTTSNNVKLFWSVLTSVYWLKKRKSIKLPNTFWRTSQSSTTSTRRNRNLSHHLFAMYSRRKIKRSTVFWNAIL